MPFTPFHLGPACAVKAVAGGSFSLTVFGFANVAMDVQPLLHLLSGEGLQHGASHTFLGATLIGVLSVLAGRPLCQYLLNHWSPDPGDRFLCWLRGPRVVSWPSAVVAAFAGTYSHVLLDGMIHTDVRPFAPFNDGNPLQGLVTFGAMHLLCIGVSILGFLGLLVTHIPHPWARVDRDKMTALRHPWGTRKVPKEGQAWTPAHGLIRRMSVRCRSSRSTWTG